MTFNPANFDDPNFLIQCRHSEDNITITDRSLIFLDRIDTITFIFCTKNFTEKIFFFKICYCNKLDIKLIFLGMLNYKDILFSSSGGVLKVQDR